MVFDALTKIGALATFLLTDTEIRCALQNYRFIVDECQ
jgi:hypothetical protein